MQSSFLVVNSVTNLDGDLSSLIKGNLLLYHIDNQSKDKKTHTLSLVLNI